MCIKRKKKQPETFFVPKQLSADQQLMLLKDHVSKLEGYKEGTMGTLRWIGLIIAILGVAGIIQFANTSIERSVEKSVDQSVKAIVGELGNQLDNVENAVSRAENAVGRAESAANSADDSVDDAKEFVASVYATATAVVEDENSGDWTIIISSDVTVQLARYEVNRASDAGYSSTIYKIGDYYATTIGRHKTKNEAQTAMIPIRAVLDSEAYPIDMADSCPYPRYYEVEDFYVCFFTPQAADE